MRACMVLALLGGCPDEPVEPCNGKGYASWLADLEPQPMANEAPGVAVVLDTRDAEGRWWVDMMLDVDNDSDIDCVFAAYISDAPPDPAAAPTFAADDVPPAAIDGLGDLLVADLVSRRWKEPGTIDSIWPFWQPLADGPARPIYLTFIGCAGMTVSASFDASSCDQRIEGTALEVGW